METDKPKRRKLPFFYWSAVGFLLLLGCLYWLFFFRFEEYTSDAYVEGNQIFITPLHEGFVTAIHTDDTFLVKEGQVLIELNDTDARIALDAAKENLAQTVRTVCELFHQVFAYQAEIAIKKAEWIKAEQDYQHRKDVIDQGGVSLEDFEHAIAALDASYSSLKMVEILYEKALALVQGTSLTKHPLVLSAVDKFRRAWVELYRCKVYSPVEGIVAQRKIQVGMWVNAGQPMLSVIPLNQIWVNANFKETQLKHVRIGQRVKITSDLYGRGVRYHGEIVGLPGAAGNAFSLLPPQNLSGNWIKIVQRLPVRVRLDEEELKNYPLRIGLSMHATVDLHQIGGELVPTSTKNSPHYQTPIFKKEEIGDQGVAEKIIFENLDPKLSAYVDSPLG